jgi:isochorismate hydrolase
MKKTKNNLENFCTIKSSTAVPENHKNKTITMSQAVALMQQMQCLSYIRQQKQCLTISQRLILIASQLGQSR